MPKNKNKNKNQAPRKSPEVYREEQRQKRVEQASQDNVEVVSRRVADTGDFILLIRSNDFAMSKLRLLMGRIDSLPVALAGELLERNEKIRRELNQLNIDMFKAIGAPYTPPHRYRSTPAPKAKPEGKKVKAPAAPALAQEETAPTEVAPAQPAVAVAGEPAPAAP